MAQSADFRISVTLSIPVDTDDDAAEYINAVSMRVIEREVVRALRQLANARDVDAEVMDATISGKVDE